MENTQANIELAVTRWLEIAIKRYRFYIDKNRVGFSQNLWNSFTENVIRGSGGDVSKLEIRFLYYGRFVDMGVGRGFPIGSRRALGDAQFGRGRNAKGQTLNKIQRKPKKWYSKTTAYEVGRLSDILAKEFGINVKDSVETILKNSGIEMNF